MLKNRQLELIREDFFFFAFSTANVIHNSQSIKAPGTYSCRNFLSITEGSAKQILCSTGLASMTPITLVHVMIKIQVPRLRTDVHIHIQLSIIFPGIGTLACTISFPMGEYSTPIMHVCRQLQPHKHTFLPPGTHHCWVGSGSME